jgi:hypothetical protein
MPDTPPTSVTFYYEQAGEFSTHHADGAQVGATPHGNIYMSFYLERPLNPKKVTIEVTKIGQLGKIISQQLELGTDPGIPAMIRELQTSIVLSVPVAKGLLETLRETVAKIEGQVTGQQKSLEAAPKERQR